MNRLALRFLNLPGLILIALVGIAIQTSFFTFWPIHFFQPDILLLITIWVALKRGFIEGGCITLIIADFAELHSAAPQGLLMISYMCVFLAVRGLSRLVVIPNLISLVTATLFVSVFWKLVNLGVLHLLGASANQWRHTLLYLFPGAIIESIAGLWVFRWLEKYDWATFKTARQEAGHGIESNEPLEYGEGLRLENEGI